MNDKLAIAYAVKRKMDKKKMADGGPVQPEPSSADQFVQGFKKALGDKPKPKPQAFSAGGIAKAIRAKKMSEGGSVSDDDEFLTADMDEAPANEEFESETYPDPDNTEGPEQKRKSRLSKIMEGLQSKK